MRVQEHLSGKSGKSAIHDHISSCKDCHSCSISNFYTLSQANTDFEAKIKEALHIKIYTIIKQPNISLWFFILVKYFIKTCIVFIKSIFIRYFFRLLFLMLTSYDLNTLGRCDYLRKRL